MTAQQAATQPEAIWRLSPKPRTFWSDIWLVLRRDKAALAGGVIAIVLLALAVVAPYLAPYDYGRQLPNGLNDDGSPVPPGREFLMGTDALGRDVLSRLLWGGRVSLSIGIASSLLAVAIGMAVGALAGYSGGLVDSVLMRGVDIVMGFPVLLLSVALVAVLSPNAVTVTIVIALVSWTYLSRIVYNEIRSLKEREFVTAAHSIGVPHLRIVFRHLSPHLVSIAVVYGSLGIATAIMLESTLSYVGIGVQPPVPSWGNMINDGQQYYRTAPWLVLFPGLLIALTVLAFNLLGDGLRDACDPYTRTRKF